LHYLKCVRKLGAILNQLMPRLSSLMLAVCPTRIDGASVQLRYQFATRRFLREGISEYDI
jgi:hypothetical protein